MSVVDEQRTVITYNLPCHRCAYNLRGLPVNGRCPECSASVDLSVSNNRFRGIEPRHIRRIVRGTRMTGIANVATLIAILVASYFGGGGAREYTNFAVTFTVMSCRVWAIWQWTVPLAQERDDRSPWLNWLVRGCAAAGP